MSTNNTIDKIGNIYFKDWKPGFDGNICGVKGVYPTITLSNNTGGYCQSMLKKNARLERMYQRGFRPHHAMWIDTYNKQYGKDIIYTVLAGISSRNHYYVAVEL